MVPSQFTEPEAAQELGISVEQLRSLIRNVMSEDGADQSDLVIAQLQGADLLLLRMIVSGGASVATAWLGLSERSPNPE